MQEATNHKEFIPEMRLAKSAKLRRLKKGGPMHCTPRNATAGANCCWIANHPEQEPRDSKTPQPPMGIQSKANKKRKGLSPSRPLDRENRRMPSLEMTRSTAKDTSKTTILVPCLLKEAHVPHRPSWPKAAVITEARSSPDIVLDRTSRL